MKSSENKSEKYVIRIPDREEREKAVSEEMIADFFPQN